MWQWFIISPTLWLSMDYFCFIQQLRSFLDLIIHFLNFSQSSQLYFYLSGKVGWNCFIIVSVPNWFVIERGGKWIKIFISIYQYLEIGGRFTTTFLLTLISIFSHKYGWVWEVIYKERESVLYHGIKTQRSVLKNKAVGQVF